MYIKNRLLQILLFRPKVAYIHVPKTGGTYIRQYESGRKPVISPILDLGHTYVVENKKIKNPVYEPSNITSISFLRKYIVVSTVRNIFDWLVSYAGHAGGWNPKYRNPDHHDFEAANQGFEYLLKTIANRETPWPSRRFIFCQLFCSNGDFVVDWICDLSSLDEDLKKLGQDKNLIYMPSTTQRVGKRGDYRAYYSDDLIDLVHQTWEHELNLFGYSFDSIYPKITLPWQVRHEIFPTVKEKIKYFWDVNKFIMV